MPDLSSRARATKIPHADGPIVNQSATAVREALDRGHDPAQIILDLAAHVVGAHTEALENIAAIALFKLGERDREAVALRGLVAEAERIAAELHDVWQVLGDHSGGPIAHRFRDRLYAAIERSRP